MKEVSTKKEASLKDGLIEYDVISRLACGVHRQIITNKLENEFVDIVVNGFHATYRHDTLLPGARMPAGGVVYEGDELVDFQVDPTGETLWTQWKSGQVEI